MSGDAELDRYLEFYNPQSRPGRLTLVAIIGWLAMDVLLAVSGLCRGPQSPRQEPTALSYYQQAERHFREQNLKKAQQAAARALQLAPRMAEAADLLGLIAAISGRTVEAETYFKRALDSRPDYGPAHYNLAKLYLTQNKVDMARQELEVVVRFDPSHGGAQYLLGLTLLKANDPQNALGHFEKAYRTNPGSYEGLVGLLTCQLELKRQLEASQSLQKINRLLGPRDPRRLELGVLLADRGAYALAIPVFQQILEADPDSYDANYNLALALYITNDTEGAETVLKRLLLRHNVAELHDLLGQVYERRKQYAQAATEYQQAASLDPTNEDFRFNYCAILVQHRALDLGINLLTEATKDFPNSGRMWVALGGAKYVRGDYGQALQDILRATDVAPYLNESYYYLGRLYSKVGAGSQERVMERLKSYLARNPNDPWAYCFYGVGLFHEQQERGSKDFADAEAHLRKAIGLKSDFAEAHFRLGLILRSQGRIADSLGEFLLACEFDPEMPEVHYHLGLTYSRLGEKEKAEKEFRLQHELRAQTAEKRRKDFVQIVPNLKNPPGAENR